MSVKREPKLGLITPNAMIVPQEHTPLIVAPLARSVQTEKSPEKAVQLALSVKQGRRPTLITPNVPNVDQEL